MRASVLDKSAILHAILFKFRLQDHIVRDCPQEHFQAVYVRRRFDKNMCQLTDEDRAFLENSWQAGSERTAIRATLSLDYPNENLPSCGVCLALHGRLGSQEIVCDRREFKLPYFHSHRIGLDRYARSAFKYG